MSTNIFSLIKNANIDIKEYIQRNYPTIHWEKDKCVCPFHDDSKPSMSYNAKQNFVYCFSCGTGGDVITFTEKYHKVSKIEAAKIVCQHNGISIDDETSTDLTPEQKAQMEAELQARNEEIAKQKAIKEKELQAIKEKATLKMTPYAANLATNLDKYFDMANKHLGIFNKTAHFSDWRDIYVGYDIDEDSICILNRLAKDGKTFNIKHRTKNGFDGKWISFKDSTTHPFPYDYFMEHDSDMVVLCEGEKDALNLLSLNVNCLTLGGVTNSWDKYKHLLKDKSVYIFFDNDEAGYINAIKRYKELREHVKDIFITLFFHINSSYGAKFDISDFIFDRNIKSADEFFGSIAYSSYKLTNSLIDDISEYIGVDLKDYKEMESFKKWKDIKAILSSKDVHGQPKYIVPAKGELDDKYIDEMLGQFKIFSKTKEFEEYKKAITSYTKMDLEKAEKAFEDFIKVKQTLLSNYRQVHTNDMVDAFMKMGQITGFTFGQYRGEFCVWTGTHYMLLTDDEIKDFMYQVWMPMARVDRKKRLARNVVEVLENVKMASPTLETIKKEQEKRILVFTNGTLMISPKGAITFKTVHDKKDAATNVLNFDYDPNQKCPKWQKFLNRVIPNALDQDMLMEYIGYCLLPSHAYEAFLFLYGKSGSNGKSVILNTIRAFFGEENVSNLQLQQFDGHEMQGLQNKIINIGSEIDVRGLDKGQASTLKALVSPKDQIQINPKNKEPYSLKPNEKPKLLFSGNDKPKAGFDDAVFRRMLFLGFDAEIKDGEKVRNLEDRFTDELSGILNLALEGLKRLITNGRFSKSDKMLLELEEYKDEVNPIRKYISENVLKISNSMVAKKFVYAHYKEWAHEKGGRVLGEQSFWTKMKQEMQDIDTAGSQIRMGIEQLDQEQPRMVKGLFIKNDEVYSFPYNNKEVKTDFINYDLHSKSILVMEK